MQYFLKPSWKRYKKLFLVENNRSILRTLQYEMLKKTPIKGTVLDFGGGKKADYLKFVNFDFYESINISTKIQPRYVTKVGQKFPCPSGRYDNVISMNTIEHVYDSNFAIKEMFRVLKENGKFIATVPFLYPIHAHPDDYFRPTNSWWEKSLLDAGFKNIKITPLLWGPFSTGLVCSGLPGPFKRVRMHLALISDLFFIKLRNVVGKKSNVDTLPCVLGYFIEAKK